MICSSCGTLNPDGSKKCVKCGAKLSLAPKIKPKQNSAYFPGGYQNNAFQAPSTGKVAGNLKSNLRSMFVTFFSLLILIVVVYYIFDMDNINNYWMKTLNIRDLEAEMRDSLRLDSLRTDSLAKFAQQKRLLALKTRANRVKKKPLTESELAEKYKKKNKQDTTIYYGKDNKKMMFIPSQEFTMGFDKGSEIEKPAHKVKIYSFYMDVYEVTNGEFKRFLKESGYKPLGKLNHFDNYKFNGDRQPVVDITYLDAAAYAKWANKRLPTEKEWECAARAGVNATYANGDSVLTENNAWYGKSFGTGYPQKVGMYKPNSYGIYDLAGNVAEWVQGYFSQYPGNMKQNSAYGKIRLAKGGSWLSLKKDLTAYRRTGLNVSESLGNIGFRCVISKTAVMTEKK